MVTTKPLKLIGVNGSWKTMPAAEMVTTSLNMPQMLSVTTDVRLSSANSDDVIKKASTPGKRSMPIPRKTPFSAARTPRPWLREVKPSTGIAIMARVRNMTGAKKKMVLKGLLVAGFRNRRICVKAQRKPEKNADEMINMKPIALKAVSPATIMITPMVMAAIMRISLMEGVSRRKRKAKSRTKANAEDLHIADTLWLAASSTVKKIQRTKKGERDEFKAHVAKPNIKSRSRPTRTDPSDIKDASHQRFVFLGRVPVGMIELMRIGNTVMPWTESWKKEKDG